MPKVMITGGTGLVGKNLTTALIMKGYEVIILSRRPVEGQIHQKIKYATWNLATQEIDGALAEADYIIHLAGAGVMEKKWTKKYKNEIITSRTKSSELLIKGLRENTNKVKTIISASAIGWYGKDHDLKHKEAFIESDKPDKSFLGETCRYWEKSIEPVEQLGKRLVKLRFGIVLSRAGGALEEFKKPLRYGIAAILGNGKQVISWVHIDDLCRMIIYAMEDEHLSGSYNAVAPSPVTNKIFILKLAALLRHQFYIPVHVPQFFLKLFMGERSIEILKSTTVSCEKIKAEGFIFLYPTIDAALKELIIK
jgi:uncharacterized protein